MKLTILAVGTRMPKWVSEPVSDYCARMPRGYAMQVLDVTPANRKAAAPTSRYLEQERDAILKHIADGSRIVALDMRGKNLATESLANQMDRWSVDGRPVVFLIGGPDGLHPELLAMAELKWSLSALTFPHPLARLIVTEQLYRAWTVLQNHPYHLGH